MTNENKIGNKNTTLKNLPRRRKIKIDKVSSQLTSSRSKYASKLKSLELETGKTIDSLLVELKLVKDINEKIVSQRCIYYGNFKGVLTTTYDSLYDWLFTDSSAIAILIKFMKIDIFHY